MENLKMRFRKLRQDSGHLNKNWFSNGEPCFVCLLYRLPKIFSRHNKKSAYAMGEHKRTNESEN